MRAAALFALSIASCDPERLSHDEIERIRLDDESTVEVRLQVSPTLLDDIAEARVVLVREGREPLLVLEDWAEAHGIRGKTFATQLGPGGAVAVFLRVTLCVLSVGAGSFRCFSLVGHAPHSELSEDLLRGLEWVIRDPRVYGNVRVRAASALASARALALPRALSAIEAGLDAAGQTSGREGSLELRALQHGLAPTEPSQRALCTAIREGSNSEALAVAQGCARSLEGPLDEKFRDAPLSMQRDYDEIRARCQRPP